MGEALQNSFHSFEIFVTFTTTNLLAIVQQVIVKAEDNILAIFIPPDKVTTGGQILSSEQLISKKAINDLIIDHQTTNCTVNIGFFFKQGGVMLLNAYVMTQTVMKQLCNAIHTYVYIPLHSTSDTPSIGGHLVFAVALSTIIWKVVQYSVRKPWQNTVFIAFLTLLWIYLVSVETTQRQQLVNRIKARAVQSVLDLQATDKNYVPNSLNPHHPSPNNSFSSLPSLPSQFENTAWANIALKAFWLISREMPSTTSPSSQQREDGSQSQGGGLGLYVSDSIKFTLNEALQNVPPGIASMRLKSLSLGSNPPLLKGVRVHSVRVNTGNKSEEAAQYSEQSREVQRKKTTIDIDSPPSIRCSSIYEEECDLDAISNVGNLIHVLSDSIKDSADFIKAFTSQAIHGFVTILKEDAKVIVNTMRRKSNTPFNATSPSSEDLKGSVDQCDLLARSSSRFDRIIVDLDFVFTTSDLDFVITLRFLFV